MKVCLGQGILRNKHKIGFWKDLEKLGFPRGAVVKNLPAMQETQVDAWVGKIPWRRAWKVTPVFCILGLPLWLSW